MGVEVLGGESIVKDPSGVRRWRLIYRDDGDIDLVRCNSSGVDQETVLNIDGATGTVTLYDLNTTTQTGLLTVGATDDTTTTPQIRLRKSEAGTGQIEFYSAGVRRMQIELSTTENGAIRVYNSGGTLVATTDIINSSGEWRFPQNVRIAGALDHDGSTVGFYAVTPVAQAADMVALTDSSGGTADNTVAAMPDPADTPASADALRDDLVANFTPAVRNNFADVTAKINAIRTALRNIGIMA